MSVWNTRECMSCLGYIMNDLSIKVPNATPRVMP